MKRHYLVFRIGSLVMLVSYLNLLLFSNVVFGQEIKCDFDPDNPSLENARKNFLALNYDCAEQELNSLLQHEDITIEEKADAHVLLAEVYYAKVRNDGEKKSKVIEQFVSAFKAYREWRGELNIKSPEFMAMMKEAQNIVDQEVTEAEPAGEPIMEEEEKPEEIVPVTTMEGKKKPWYTQWWAIGLGVGLVAGGVILLAGGGDEDGNGAVPDTLPNFPDPPTK